MLVRRHRPGRHRVDDAGPRRYRQARCQGGMPVRPMTGRATRPGRHIARRTPPAPQGALLARYASLLVVLFTVLISGWFAASGASAFAQLIGC